MPNKRMHTRDLGRLDTSAGLNISSRKIALFSQGTPSSRPHRRCFSEDGKFSYDSQIPWGILSSWQQPKCSAHVPYTHNPEMTVFLLTCVAE